MGYGANLSVNPSVILCIPSNGGKEATIKIIISQPRG